MTIDELKYSLRNNGVVGAGGAGFPTYEKLFENPKYLIMNAAECEPLFKVDQELIINYPYEVLKGFSIIMETLNIPKGIISLKESYFEAISVLEENIKFFKNIEIKKLRDSYPLGDELVLIYESIGESIPQGNIPKSKGVLVINVETSYNIFQSVINNFPVIETFLTVSGDIEKPISLSVPIGLKVKDVLKGININLKEDHQLIIGGPMTGRIGSLETVITKTTKGILIFPKNKKICTSHVGNYKNLKHQGFSACSQCRMCTDLCPRNLLGYDISPHKIMNTVIYDDNYLNLLGVFSCCECNVCTLYACHQSLNPMRIIRELKDKLRKAGLKPVQKEVSPLREREFRKIPGKSLKQRLGIINYDKKAPLSKIKINSEIYYIDLQQHIGMKSIPVVDVSSQVKINQLVANAAEGLGVCIHSPVNGEVIQITERYILIRRGDN